MNSEMKTQVIGLSFVAVALMAAGVIVAFFLRDMVDNTLMGASAKYAPNYPTIPITDVSQASQCVEGYDKNWIGCQKPKN